MKNADKLLQMYETHGFSVGGDHIKKEDYPVPSKIPMEILERWNTCQGCSHSFEDESVMIVDGVGPICMRCLHNCACLLLDPDPEDMNEAKRTAQESAEVVPAYDAG